jgi:hypothetical protein
VRARGFFSGGAGSYLGRAMPAVARRARVDPAAVAGCTMGYCVAKKAFKLSKGLKAACYFLRTAEPDIGLQVQSTVCPVRCRLATIVIMIVSLCSCSSSLRLIRAAPVPPDCCELTMTLPC